MWYKVKYCVRNYVYDNKCVLYLPIIFLVGMIIGFVIAGKNQLSMTNFINCMLEEGSYSYGSAFVKDYFLYIGILLAVMTVLLTVYCHIVGFIALLLFGYRFGVTIVAVIIGGGVNGVICILVSTIPLAIVSAVIIAIAYSMVIGANLARSCIVKSAHFKLLVIKLIIISLVYMLAVIIFNILSPMLYCAIFI